MRNVATKCDIALGTIYNYFPTKMDLVVAIIESFWAECFKHIHKIYNQDLDFFEQLEVLYFCTLDYLEQFKTNWLSDLSSLSSINKSKGKQKEEEYMSRFIRLLEEIFKAHHEEFNKEIYSTFDEQKLIKFIFSNFMTMLKNGERDYHFFNNILKRLLL